MTEMAKKGFIDEIKEGLSCCLVTSAHVYSPRIFCVNFCPKGAGILLPPA